MSTTLKSLRYVALLGSVLLIGCDSSDEDCLQVNPDDDYVLSGTQGTQDFAPASKTYTVNNTCDSAIDLSVEEDERWLDIDIVGFSSESGELSGGGTVNVSIDVVYGSDNSERLDQLDEGSYDADIRFVDETNDSEVRRSVELTVNAP